MTDENTIEFNGKLKIGFEILCAKCEDPLSGSIRLEHSHSWEAPCVKIRPCERCLEAEYRLGQANGIEEGD